jgi:putative membrane protein
MVSENDPRIYFAAERTLLAWIRTGLATIGLGFVVARFGLFLRLMREGPEAPELFGSTLIGVGLVALGSIAMAVAAWQHGAYCRRLSPSDLPRPYLMRWPIWFAALVSAIGAVLAVYLVLRSNGAT